ncbi:MAG: TraR/DksA family transcriptional regulator [Byssovorax sp.]
MHAKSETENEAPNLPKRPPARVEQAPSSVPPLTDAQRAELKKALESMRADLLGRIEEKRAEERQTSREVGDEMDEASAEGQAAMTSKLLEREVVEADEIERALQKMKEGTYGLCEGTGEPIGFPRLKLKPWARYSVAYQEEVEREEKSRGL